ncbi:HEAT repeat domain-containing protein [Kiritimatiellaeota bacterium B1221]|nr:HEAT repeat domain-containing protein [Kiritimatiellaeota bacterium B1221]
MIIRRCRLWMWFWVLVCISSCTPSERKKEEAPSEAVYNLEKGGEGEAESPSEATKNQEEGGEAEKEHPLQTAYNLEQAGEWEEAFVRYLGIEDMAHAAVRIARKDPARYLEILETSAQEMLPVAKELVRGDLLLALDRKQEALEKYRKVAEIFQNTAIYPVDLPESFQGGFTSHRPMKPFEIGPGSHRDNWLIRRFIALDSLPDAEAEFARVWQIHQQHTQPYILIPIRLRMLKKEGKPAPLRLMQPTGFDLYGLQFALDYAFFLRQQQQEAKGLDVLAEALLAIDLDRNPNRIQVAAELTEEEAKGIPRRVNHLHYTAFNPPVAVGLSRKAFMRLTFGAFKESVGREVLFERVNTAAKLSGDPQDSARILRLLSVLYTEAGDLEASLAAELAYIENPTLEIGEWATACRKGMAYEAAGKMEEAVAQYEVALALPAVPGELPDPDEEARQRITFAPMPQEFRSRSQPIDLTGRLFRLYTALGEEEKALKMSLREIEAAPASLERDHGLQKARKLFVSANREEEFVEWTKEFAQKIQQNPPPKVNTDLILLNLAFAGNDLEQIPVLAARQALGKSARYGVSTWGKKLQKRKDGSFEAYLVELRKLNPTHPHVRLQLLDWEGAVDSTETLAEMAALLKVEDPELFPWAGINGNETSFKSIFDQAYRVMRGYERAGELDALQALGLRIAEGQQPFGEWWAVDVDRLYRYRDENQWPEDLNGVLALLIEKSDPATLARLEELWAAREDFPAKRQLARRLQGAKKQPQPEAVPWANAPEGVDMMVSNENVLSIAATEDRIYAGMPWGLCVYDREGTILTRVRLGDAVQDILVHAGFIWCATPTGLLRVNPEDWGVVLLPTDLDVDNPNPDRIAFNRGVWRLAGDGPRIWIGTRRNIQCYDTETNELRAYSQSDLGVDSRRSWERFLITEKYVWAEGDELLLRFDRASGSWSRPSCPEAERPVGLIGIFDGQLWGHVWLNNELRDRPCLIDQETLVATPVLIDDPTRMESHSFNGPFSIYGKWKDQLVFGSGRPRFVYQEETGKLIPLATDPLGSEVEIDAYVPRGLAEGDLFFDNLNEVRCSNSMSHRLEPVLGMKLHTGRWSLLRLDDTTLLLGARTENSPSYTNTYREWPGVSATEDVAGGLYLLKRDHEQDRYAVQRISQRRASNTIFSDMVFHFLPPADGQPGWLCTSRGLATVDDSFQVSATYTRADGLSNNRVVDALRRGDIVYFATGWGDQGGGLLQVHPETRVFTHFVQSDGLATDKLSGLALAEDGRILIEYDFEYGRHQNFSIRRFPPVLYDPDSGVIEKPGEAIYGGSGQEGFPGTAIQLQKKRIWSGYLGGHVISESQFGDSRILCITRGVLRLSAEAEPLVDHPQLEPRGIESKNREQYRAAKDFKLERKPDIETLRTLLADENPYLVIRALTKVDGRLDEAPELIPLVGRALDSALLRSRSTALVVLSESPRKEVLPYLRQAEKDPHPYLRQVAAIAVLGHGERPAEIPLKKLFEQGKRFGNYPYGLTTTVGGIGGYEKIIAAMAPYATAEDFELMLDYPISSFWVEGAFEDLGRSIRKNPAVVDVLLQAYDFDWRTQRVGFAQSLFKAAGTEILPALRQALKSEERIVRSNAARACGAIGDPSVIPQLIEALDLESGLSRASIVWALGELKAEEAITELSWLHAQAIADEKQQGGSGYRFSQIAAESQDQFQHIESMDVIAADWDELKASKQDPPVNPRKYENLLSTRQVIEAASKMDATQLQGFWREMAGSKDRHSREAAAKMLAKGSTVDREANITVLKGLLADEDREIEMIACGSLLLLEDWPPAIARLKTALENEYTYTALEQINRLRKTDVFEQFRPQIQKIAEAPAGTYQGSSTQKLAQRLLKP